jgi:CheY-like chemotaxis protein
MLMDFSKLSVLIVEDLVPMQRLLKDIIQTLGVGTIYTSSNGKHGYTQYISKQPDMIVTDWHMPELDGIELIEKIRKNPDSPRRDIPIIMISGLNASARITKARDIGVTEYLVKPFNVQALAKRISRTISQPRDFVITEDFVGPDRRRIISNDFKENPRRVKEPEKIIKANKDLLLKVGKGQINPNLVTRSEKVLEETKIDFVPIAKSFLGEFKNALDAAEKSRTHCKKIKEDLTFSIMQLKANARIFKYGLIGELSSTTLEFLESTPELDNLILQILNAQHATISHLVHTDTKGDGGKAGESLKTELKEAYKRYNNVKALQQKDAFVVELQKVEASK